MSAVYSPNPFNDGAAKPIFNGWTIAPILNAFSGQRVTGNISGNINPTSFGFASNQTPGGGINGSGGSSRFALVPRNFFKQPNIWYLDAQISRRFSLTESVKLEVLAEGFNVFNRTQVTNVNPTIYNQSGTTLTFNGVAPTRSLTSPALTARCSASARCSSQLASSFNRLGSG